MININYENETMFGGDDFVFTRNIDPKTGDSIIIGGGYKVNSFFLKDGMPIITTFNNLEQSGGSDKVSSFFENLAVPAGLFYINQQHPKDYVHNEKDKTKYNYNKHETISDDMIDKLFGLIEVNKKQQRKTRKHVGKSKNNKTRKHN